MSGQQGAREVGMRPSAIVAGRRYGGFGNSHLPEKEAES